MFIVETQFTYGWENVWVNEDVSQTFETHDLAMAAIYEFFADLSRAGMVHGYQLEDYRVTKIDAGAVNP